MAFVPIAKDNAIQEVVFTVGLQRPADDHAIAKLKSAHVKWDEFLPRVGDIRGFLMEFNPAGPPEAPKLAPGVSFERVKPNGDIAWRLALEQNMLIVNCTEYTRWDEVASVAVGRLVEAMEALEIAIESATAITLEVIDAFFWTDEARKPSARDLFTEENSFLPSYIKESSALWHVHQGQFLQPSGDQWPKHWTRCLDRVNLDANEVQSRYRYSIDHQMRLDLNFERSERLGFEAAQSKLELRRAFDYMHHRNKEVVAELLIADMSDRISLFT